MLGRSGPEEGLHVGQRGGVQSAIDPIVVCPYGGRREGQALRTPSRRRRARVISLPAAPSLTTSRWLSRLSWVSASSREPSRSAPATGRGRARGRQRLEVVGAIEPVVALTRRAAPGAGRCAGRGNVGALEHDVLEQVREPRPALVLVREPTVVPQVDRHRGAPWSGLAITPGRWPGAARRSVVDGDRRGHVMAPSCQATQRSDGVPDSDVS